MSGERAWFEELRRISQRQGPQALLAAIKDWQARVTSGPNYQDASLWLGRSVLCYRADDRDSAATALLEAVRRMTPPPPSVKSLRLDGLPSGPNVLPQTKVDLDEWLRSGPGSSSNFLTVWSVALGVLPSEEVQAYFGWLNAVSDDASSPERAMAASIWLHALAVQLASEFPEGLPPAAVRLAIRFGGQPFGEEVPLESRRRLFEAAFQAALEGADSAAVSLNKWIEAAGSNGRTSRQAEVLWSLEQEVIVRFSAVDSEAAAALRTLARHLLEWAPPKRTASTSSSR